jgi:hypothetical protein
VVGVVLGALASGCDDGDPSGGAVTTDPGPNPTPEVDPGPNDTSDGPTTVQGVLALDAATDCVALETDDGRLALRFTGYELGDDGGRPVLRASDDGRVLADEADQVVVTGRAAGDAAGSCGAPFDVESLNTVVPAP